MSCVTGDAAVTPAHGTHRPGADGPRGRGAARPSARLRCQLGDFKPHRDSGCARPSSGTPDPERRGPPGSEFRDRGGGGRTTSRLTPTSSWATRQRGPQWRGIYLTAAKELREALAGVLLRPTTADGPARSGAITLDGDPSVLETYGGLLDAFDPRFPIVTPRGLRPRRWHLRGDRPPCSRFTRSALRAGAGRWSGHRDRI
ncbi:alkyl sulfatase C-terminal domain-containing protein [Kitasatospora indigofera]|uniref:alkyl sulfatase C-terminal domain-containing protein n=1 Tax=Kitasatospora indigofera TaxID=67307 RepID=UPI00369E35CD